MAARKSKRALGPSDLVGAWYDLKAEVDKVANRLSGMVAQAEKLRERLEAEFGIAVPSLAVMVAATGERAALDTLPARRSPEEPAPGGSAEGPAAAPGVMWTPPHQGPVAGSEAAGAVDEAAAKARADAVMPGADPNAFAASVAATWGAITKGFGGGQ